MYMCIYILIRAFKNNTIYSALPPPLLLVLFFAGCVLYLKHAQQLKVFFTQIEFAPRTNLPFPLSVAVAVAAAASVAVDVAVIIAAFGIANFAASHRSLPLTTWKICCHCHVTHKIQHKKCAEKEAEKRRKKKTHEAKQRQAIQALGQ